MGDLLDRWGCDRVLWGSDSLPNALQDCQERWPLGAAEWSEILPANRRRPASPELSGVLQRGKTHVPVGNVRREISFGSRLGSARHFVCSVPAKPGEITIEAASGNCRSCAGMASHGGNGMRAKSRTTPRFGALAPGLALTGLLMSWGSTLAEAHDLAVDVIFMVPHQGEGATPRPTYRQIDDTGQLNTYRAWLDNEAAELGLELYRLAFEVMQERGEVDEVTPYHIALVPGGNHAAAGFDLVGADGRQHHPNEAYVKLAPTPDEFAMTLCHETGHVVLSILANGQELPVRPIASIPHTTAALTDRCTAFNEGFSIHLETLAAHRAQAPVLRGFYHHENLDFHSDQLRTRELHRPASDLATFAQTRARYESVRDNCYAFAGAFRGADYLRAQLDPSRDQADLRDANQLLQSEGFYATFFFSWIARGGAPPTVKTLSTRLPKVLHALAELFVAETIDEDTPYLLHFIEAYAALYPDELSEIADVFLDLTRGVFIDGDAPGLWRDHYLAALRLDVNTFRNGPLHARRSDWHRQILENTDVLYDRIGPPLPCEVSGG